VIALQGLSSHADAADLVRWVRTAPAPPRLIFVTHGEPDAAEAFAQRLQTEFSVDVRVPRLNDVFDLEQELDK